MHRTRLVALAGPALLALAISAPTMAAVPGAQEAEWHRNNYNAGEEQQTCREAAPSWTCTYRLPDATGWFSGRDVTATWTCPAWFPGGICDNVVAVYRGTFVIVPEGGASSGRSFLVPQEYVVTEVAGQPVLQLYWVDRFVCPWYRTFEEALAADFNCVVAP